MVAVTYCTLLLVEIICENVISSYKHCALWPLLSCWLQTPTDQCCISICCPTSLYSCIILLLLSWVSCWDNLYGSFVFILIISRVIQVKDSKSVYSSFSIYYHSAVCCYEDGHSEYCQTSPTKVYTKPMCHSCYWYCKTLIFCCS